MFLPIYPQIKNAQYPLNRRLDGCKSQSRCFGEKTTARSQTMVPWLSSLYVSHYVSYITRASWKTVSMSFRVCKSVHHHAFNWINQQDAATSQVYYLLFKYSSTCFGHHHAHHQELQQLQWQPLVYRQSLVIAALLVEVGPAGPTSTNSTAVTKLWR